MFRLGLYIAVVGVVCEENREEKGEGDSRLAIWCNCTCWMLIYVEIYSAAKDGKCGVYL